MATNVGRASMLGIFAGLSMSLFSTVQCKSEKPQAAATNTSPATANTPPVAPNTAPVGGNTAEASPFAAIPGLDLSSVPPRFRGDALRLLNENFCYCGCARTIAACLSARATCECVACSERMMNFILANYREGASTEQVELSLLSGFSEDYNGAAQTFDSRAQPFRGPKEANIEIVEFADFRCPHCAMAAKIIETLAETRSDIRISYFYFPLTGGGELSLLAAQAAEEAHTQGKFWPMSKLLFENQMSLSPELLETLAQRAGLDLAKFKTALKNKTHLAKVMSNKQLGEKLHIAATPTFFINGRKFGFEITLDNLLMRLDMETERGRCR